MTESQASERVLIAIIAAIQFVSIVEFMMVAPLGPDFVAGFGMASESIGVVAGSYTAAAAFSTIISASFLDRFERRRLLVLAMFGVAAGTAAGAFAYDLNSLVAARIFAGLCGGPATALALALLADAVPPERRGKAMGIVMSAFSLASVLGVPFSLELARVAGWHAPFIAVALLGALVACVAWRYLPKQRANVRSGASYGGFQAIRVLFRRPEVGLSIAATSMGMIGAFLVIPSISVFFQFNLGLPRDSLASLYLAGGAVTFVSMWLAGKYTDKLGAVVVSAVATVLLLVVTYVGFVRSELGVPLIVVFVFFMVAMSARNVAASTLNSQVPPPDQRGAFMAINSTAQNICASVGAAISSLMLGSAADGKLTGMEYVAFLSMLFAASLPVLLWMVNVRLARTTRY